MAANYVSSDDTQIEIRGSRIDVAESSSFLGYLAVSLGKYFPTFRKHKRFNPKDSYEGNSISKLQIVIEKNRIEIITYKQHLFLNIISIQI